MPRPRNEVGGPVRFLPIREAALGLEINPQTLKNKLLRNDHGITDLLKPVRCGHKANNLIISVKLFQRFRERDWPAIRADMEARGWRPRTPGRPRAEAG
jgi:hypothetical protein